MASREHAEQRAGGKSAKLPPTMPTAWMDAKLRCWLVALRPWSFPASLVPVFAAGALLVRGGQVQDLYTAPFFACLAITLATHAAANLTNTYYDFQHGVDVPGSGCDDRALVDRTLEPAEVLRAALGCFGAAALACLGIPSATLPAVGAGFALAFFYTADPFSLKARGLGEAVVFACFGPLLMGTVALACAGAVPRDVLLFAVPLGLLTVAILHANNTRDVDADAKAGLTTLAMLLGPAGSFTLHLALLGAAYLGCCALAARLAEPMLLVPLLCAPWAAYVTRRFHAGLFVELPQRIAQHNLLFGALLVAGLLERLFLARLLLAVLYALGGINNVMMWSYNVELVHMKLTNVLPRLPRSLTSAAFGAAIAGQTTCAFLFILGIQTRLMAQALLLFIVPVTFLVHDLWTIEHEHPAHVAGSRKKDHNVVSRSVPIFPTEFDNEFVHFFKNVGMAGGLVLFLVLPGAHQT